MNLKRIVSSFLVLALMIFVVSTPILASQCSGYQRGYNAGQKAASEDIESSKNLSDFLWGFGFGPLPMLYNLLVEQKIPNDRLRSIRGCSKTYREGFKEGYRDKMDESALISNAGGYATWLVVWATFFKCEGGRK